MIDLAPLQSPVVAAGNAGINLPVDQDLALLGWDESYGAQWNGFGTQDLLLDVLDGEEGIAVGPVGVLGLCASSLVLTIATTRSSTSRLFH